MASGARGSKCVETPVFSYDRTDITEMHPMVSTSYTDNTVYREVHPKASTPDITDSIGPMHQAYETRNVNVSLFPLCTSPVCSETPVFTYDAGHFTEIHPVVSTYESIMEDVCEMAPAVTFLLGNFDTSRPSAGENGCLPKRGRLQKDTAITRRLHLSHIACHAEDTSLGNKKKQYTVVQSQLDRLIGTAPDSMNTTNKKGASSGKTSNKSAPEKKLCLTPGKTLLQTVTNENTTTAIDTKDSRTKLKKPMHKTKAVLAAEYKMLGEKRKRLSGEIALIAASVRVKESMLEYAELVCRQEEHKPVDDTPVAVRTHKKRGVKAHKVVGPQAKTDVEEEELDNDEEKDEDEEDEPTGKQAVKANDDDEDEEDDDEDVEDAEDDEDGE